MEKADKQDVEILQNQHDIVDLAYEELISANAKFEKEKTKYARILRNLRIHCQASNDMALDYASGEWIKEQQIDGNTNQLRIA